MGHGFWRHQERGRACVTYAPTCGKAPAAAAKIDEWKLVAVPMNQFGQRDDEQA